MYFFGHPKIQKKKKELKIVENKFIDSVIFIINFSK